MEKNFLLMSYMMIRYHSRFFCKLGMKPHVRTSVKPVNILVGLMMTWSSEKMLISIRCICGFTPKLQKNLEWYLMMMYRHHTVELLNLIPFLFWKFCTEFGLHSLFNPRAGGGRGLQRSFFWHPCHPLPPMGLFGYWNEHDFDEKRLCASDHKLCTLRWHEF